MTWWIWIGVFILLSYLYILAGFYFNIEAFLFVVMLGIAAAGICIGWLIWK